MTPIEEALHPTSAGVPIESRTTGPNLAPLDDFNDEGERSTIPDLFIVVGRRKGLVVLGLVLGIGIACLYYFRATPIYESQVQLLVVPKQANLSTQGNDTKDSLGSYSADSSLLSTHVQLFQSRKVVKDAIEKRHLETVASLASAIEAGIDPVDVLISRISVTKGGKGAARDACVLRVAIQDTSPEDSARCLNALVESYQEFLAKTFRDASAEVVHLIQQAKNDLEEELKKAEASYKEFCEQSPLMWKGKESQNIHQQRVNELEKNLAEARANYMETRARLDIIQTAMSQKSSAGDSDLDKLALLSVKDISRLTQLLTTTKGADANVKIASDQAIRGESARVEYQQLLDLQLEQLQLLQNYGPDHPKVKTIGEKLSMMKDFLRNKAATLATSGGVQPSDLLRLHVGLLQHDLRELSERQKDLEKMARDEEAAAKRLASYEVQGDMMRSALTRKSELYEAVVQRLRDINLIKDYGGGYLTEVISPVEIPKAPISPKLLLSLGAGLVLGLLSGCGMAYVAEFSDRTFRDPEDICRSLRAPIMAHLPAFSGRPSKNRPPATEPSPDSIDKLLVAYHRPTSRESEIFRSLRTALYFSSLGKQRNVIQVTSPHPSDGKTTLAANLAVSIAQVGRKVLLVDSDLRCPRVHKVFGLRPTIGLANLLAGQAELSEAIMPLPIENLWLLPAGTQLSNPSELLTFPTFDQLIQDLRGKYDFVIVDSPPLLAVSDPAVIAPRMDGVLLVMRVEKNGRPPVVQARQILARLGVPVLGLVVNGMKQDRRYGYGYYGKYYDNFAERYIPAYRPNAKTRAVETPAPEQQTS